MFEIFRNCSVPSQWLLNSYNFSLISAAVHPHESALLYDHPFRLHKKKQREIITARRCDYLPLFFHFLVLFYLYTDFSSTSPIAFLNKSMSRPSVEKDSNLFLCVGSFFFCIFLYICRCHLFNMSFFQALIHNFPKNSIDH